MNQRTVNMIDHASILMHTLSDDIVQPPTLPGCRLGRTEEVNPIKSNQPARLEQLARLEYEDIRTMKRIQHKIRRLQRKMRRLEHKSSFLSQDISSRVVLPSLPANTLIINKFILSNIVNTFILSGDNKQIESAAIETNNKQIKTTPVETSNMPPHRVSQFVEIETTFQKELEVDTPIPPPVPPPVSPTQVCGLFPLQEVVEDNPPPSPLEDPLLSPIGDCHLQTKPHLNADDHMDTCIGAETPDFDLFLAEILLARDNNQSDFAQDVPHPKVMVEYRPLPSLYELSHVTNDLDTTALGQVGTESNTSDVDSSMLVTPPHSPS